MPSELKCPVCQARFRAAKLCSRCGADLSRLMQLAAEAWAWRESARQAIQAGDFSRAFECAARAQALQGTPAGERLLRLGAWLSGRGAPQYP